MNSPFIFALVLMIHPAQDTINLSWEELGYQHKHTIEDQRANIEHFYQTEIDQLDYLSSLAEASGKQDSPLPFRKMAGLRYETGVKHFLKLLEADTSLDAVTYTEHYLYALRTYGIAMYKSGQYRKAEKQLKSLRIASQGTPYEAIAYYYLCELSLRINDRDGHVAYMKQAVATPDIGNTSNYDILSFHLLILQNLALTEAQIGDYAAAVNSFNLIYEIAELHGISSFSEMDMYAAEVSKFPATERAKFQHPNKISAANAKVLKNELFRVMGSEEAPSKTREVEDEKVAERVVANIRSFLISDKEN